MVSTRQQCSSGSTTTKVAVITKPEKSFSVVSLGQSCSSQSNQANLLDLPYELLEKILSYTNFKHISQLRIVCSINIVAITIFNFNFILFLFPGFSAV